MKPNAHEQRTDYAVSVHRQLGGRKLNVLASADRIIPAIIPTVEQPMIVSTSELGSFLRCRVQWYWKYVIGMRRIHEQAFKKHIGILVHEVLEAWYSLPYKKRDVAAMKKIARKMTRAYDPEQLDKGNKDLAEAMCVGYAQWAMSEDKIVGIKQCTPEGEFSLPLNDEGTILVRGKIDNVFEPRSLKKTLACQESKTKTSIDFDVVDTSAQVSTYLWAMMEKHPGYKSYVCFYTVLRRQMPGPRVRADLFGRTPVERTAAQIEQWVADTKRAARDMLDAAIYPNPTKDCKWDCDFTAPCLMRGEKKDLKWTLGSEFTTREQRDKEEKRKEENRWKKAGKEAREQLKGAPR